MLSERVGVTLEAARKELATLEADYRERRKTLKALVRALEAEQPKDEGATDE